MEFFEYEDSVFEEFHENIKSIFTPIILIGFYNLFKFIFIKNNIFYLIIYKIKMKKTQKFTNMIQLNAESIGIKV